MGTPAFAERSLAALLSSDLFEVTLVITRPDEPAGRGQKLISPPVALLAKRATLPVLQPEKIRNEDFYERLRAERADVIVVVAYGKILPKQILEIPRLGCVNVHGSLL